MNINNFKTMPIIIHVNGLLSEKGEIIVTQKEMQRVYNEGVKDGKSIAYNRIAKMMSNFSNN